MAIKTLASEFIYKLGGVRLLCRHISRSKAFVLMYHRVLANPGKEPIPVQPGMYVSTDTFRQHLTFLKSRFHVLHLSELVARIAAGRSVANCCAITFDDGWRDNYTQAYPLLREFNLPATVFLATGFISTGRIFWPEAAAFYLQQPGVIEAGRQDSVLRPFLDKLPDKATGSDWIDQAVDALKAKSPSEREEIIGSLRNWCGQDLPRDLLMTWEMARQMISSGLVEFGAHSHNHVILDQVASARAEQEISQSKAELERQLGVSPALFAYPNGNHTPGLQMLLKKHGFKAAVTTRKGCCDSRVPLMEIPRIGVHEDVGRTIPLFAGRIFLKRF